MKVIWKFPLKIMNQQQIHMPKGASILSAGKDADGVICLWARVNPELPCHVYAITIVGAGRPIEDADMWTFVDTVVDAPFVWHVFQFLYDGGEVEAKEITNA